MSRMFKFLGVLVTALTLGAFALPSGAAGGPAKIFGLAMSPSKVNTTPTPLTVTFSNQTPNGNSVINTVILSPPAGGSVGSPTFPNGGSSVACPATTVNSAGQTVPVPPGSICVAGIPSVMKAGCSPTACSWSFNVTATLPACAVSTWSGQAFAGNSFNGDVFAFQPQASSVTTTVGGCAVTATSSNTSLGTVNEPTSVAVALNSTPSFTVTPKTGYHAEPATGTCPVGTVVGNTYTTGPITGPCNLVANFAINTYTITATAGANGGIDPSGSVGTSYGATPDFKVSPATGYHIASVGGTCGPSLKSGDGVKESIYTVAPVAGNCAVSATFAIDTFMVTPSPGANGSMTPSTPQSVNWNASTSFTVTPTTGYYITGTTDNCGAAGVPNGSFNTGTGVYTTGSITANCTVSATFAQKTLTIPQPPTSFTVGSGNTVKVVVTPGGPVPTMTSNCGATETHTSDATSTTFIITIPAMPDSGKCTVTFSSPGYLDAALTDLKVYKGKLFCGDYDSVNGPNDPAYDPDAQSTIPGMGTSYVGDPGWGLRRGPNKDGSECVKINYSCELNALTNIAECTWDKASGQQATFKYLFVWTPKPPVSGWTEFRPWVSWGIASPSATVDLPDWVPILSCDSDTFSVPPTAILPIIPSVLPFSDLVHNTRTQYQPNGTRQAMVCLAATGWTAVGTPGNPSNQMWHIVIDEADLKMSGP